MTNSSLSFTIKVKINLRRIHYEKKFITLADFKAYEDEYFVSKQYVWSKKHFKIHGYNYNQLCRIINELYESDQLSKVALDESFKNRIIKYYKEIKKITNKTINKKLMQIRSICKYISKKYSLISGFDYEKLKETPYLGTVNEATDFDKIFNVLSTLYSHNQFLLKRNTLLLSTMLETGIRRGELVNLRINNFKVLY